MCALDSWGWVAIFSPNTGFHHRTTPVTSPLHPPKRHSLRRHAYCRASPAATAVGPPTAPSSTPPECIAVLPVGVVQRIASGELLHGVHSVVRELVENSLDACATRIAVDLDTRTLTTTVTDDGRGMAAEELPSAATCNATSKLRDIAGLDAGVSTLGFRGQGLWAVASAAEDGLSVQARTEAEDIGLRLAFAADGRPVPASKRCIPMARGAVVRAAGLRRWGPLDARARRKVREWLAAAALTRRDVAFRMTVDGRPVWRCDPVPPHAGGAAAALAAAYGRPAADFRAAVAPVQGVSGGGGSVQVAAGLPDLVRAGSTRWVFIALNGRIVQLPAVTSALRAAIALPTGKFPVMLVDILLPAACVDWNVSPVKSDVRLRGDGTLEQVVKAALQAMRAAVRWMPSSGSHGVVDPDASLLRLVHASGDCGPEPQKPSVGLGENLVADESDEAVVGWTSFRVIAQLLDTYILVEHPEGITLIEQHVADERARYESLLNSWSSSFTGLPASLPLPNSITDEQVYNLVSLGFEVDPSDDGWLVTTAPSALACLPPADLTVALTDLSCTAHTPASAAAKLSCDASVRNGTKLSLARMRSLVSELGRCEDARTCPHGRRIALPLSARALGQLFGRPVGGLPRSGRL